MTITRELGAMPLPEGTNRFGVQANVQRPPTDNAAGLVLGLYLHVRALMRGGVGVILESEDASAHLPPGVSVDIIAEGSRMRVVFETNDPMVTASLSYIQQLSESGRAVYGTVWRPTKEVG